MIMEMERLQLRNFEEADFNTVYAYASDGENLRYMLFPPNDEAATRQFLRYAIGEAEKEPRRIWELAVIQKDSGGLIGGCSIQRQDDHEAEVGWMLRRDCWNKGYGTELAEALLAFGFGGLGLHRIIAHCHTENIGSWRVMEKIGMRREGRFVEARPPRPGFDDNWADEYAYAILRREWEDKEKG